MKYLDDTLDSWIHQWRRRPCEDMETWKALPWFFVITVLFYFSALAFFSISIDSELAATRVHSGVWISQGRWTAYVIERFLFPKIIVPFLPTALFCFAASLAYVFILIAHKLKANYVSYLAFPIFCAFPTWRLIGGFSANLPSVAWGLLACSIAAWLYSKISVAWAQRPASPASSRLLVLGILAQALLLATAVGAYQTYVLVFSCFGLGIIIRMALADKAADVKAITRMLVLLAIAVVSGLLIYVLVERLLLYTLHIQLSYLQDFYHPTQLLETPLRVIHAVLRRAAGIYSGSPSIYGAPLTAVFIIMLLGVYAVTTSTRRLTIWGLAVVILFAPFAMSFISGTRIPPRSLIAVSYVVWLFAVLALEYRSRLIKILASVALLVSLFQILYLSSYEAAIKQLTQQQDMAMAALIYDRIASVNPDFDRDHATRVDFFGCKQMDNTLYPVGKGSTAASSFFGWDYGDPKRIVAFMRLLGYSNLAIAEKEERLALVPEYLTMPIWPAPGSVKRVGDITLVKLGTVPGQYGD